MPAMVLAERAKELRFVYGLLITWGNENKKKKEKKPGNVFLKILITYSKWSS